MTDTTHLTHQHIEDIIVGTEILTPDGICTLACQLLASMQHNTSLKAEIDYLDDQLKQAVKREKRLREALQKIARPALGGKLQQQIAQIALHPND